MRSFSVLLICAAFVVLTSCATKPPSEDFFEEELVVEEETMEEEEFIEEEVIVEEPLEEPVIEPEVISPPPPEALETLGFRVQIYAFSSRVGANSAAESARLQFPERVYVDYVAPYYKVRVGDCVTRAEADMLKARARQFGYTDAFIVETMVTP